MTGILTTFDQQRWQLPPLHSWQFLYTDGSSCDSFCVRFLRRAEDTAPLRGAVFFSASEGGAVRFTGIVDEVSIEESSDGAEVCICGRSLLGRLLDSTVSATQWSRASWQDIAAKYLYPYGITQIETACAIPDIPLFQVDAGTTCFAAVGGFLRHSCGASARMRPDGTLLIGGQGERYALTAESGLLRAVWRQQRYGVCSSVRCIRKGGAVTVRNDTFAARGGLREQVFTEDGLYLRASHRTAQQRLAESAAEFETLEVRLPGSFPAEPGDRIEVSLPLLGAEGVFSVREAESRCRAEDGLTCRLLLRRGI